VGQENCKQKFHALFIDRICSSNNHVSLLTSPLLIFNGKRIQSFKIRIDALINRNPSFLSLLFEFVFPVSQVRISTLFRCLQSISFFVYSYSGTDRKQHVYIKCNDLACENKSLVKVYNAEHRNLPSIDQRDR
jgi:hypothetical protein